MKSFVPFLNSDLSQYTIILANGCFPNSRIGKHCFSHGARLICCDGATQKACSHGRIPDYIIGDCDSISPQMKEYYKNKVIEVFEQETNDLTKAFNYCITNGWRKIIILGATGEREDHTLGNIARLVDFAEEADDIKMITDNGIFLVALQPGSFKTTKGTQVSIFSFNPTQKITSQNLKYPLKNLCLPRWYTATLNEASSDVFSLEFTPTSPILLFMSFQESSY